MWISSTGMDSSVNIYNFIHHHMVAKKKNEIAKIM